VQVQEVDQEIKQKAQEEIEQEIHKEIEETLTILAVSPRKNSDISLIKKNPNKRGNPCHETLVRCLTILTPLTTHPPPET
jgi:hypothetical protein